jgi:hypothetical protein
MEVEQPGKGDLVNFTPAKGERGLRAKNVQRLVEQVKTDRKNFVWESLDRFQFTASATTNRGKLIGTGAEFYQQASDCSIDDLRERIKGTMQSMGANAVLNYRYERKTGRRGNYRYTIHRVYGTPALIGNKVPCEDPGLEDASYTDLKSRVGELQRKATEQARKNQQAEAAAAAWSALGWGVITCVIVVFFIGI